MLLVIIPVGVIDWDEGPNKVGPWANFPQNLVRAH